MLKKYKPLKYSLFFIIKINHILTKKMSLYINNLKKKLNCQITSLDSGFLSLNFKRHSKHLTD